MEPRIFDLTPIPAFGGKLKDADFRRIDAGESHCDYFKFGLEHVQRIVELVYLPHQVEQWNQSLDRPPSMHLPPLKIESDERKPVTLEELLPGAMKTVREIFEQYVSIPKGDYYVCPGLEAWGQFNNWNDIRFDSGPSYFISRKRFDGFVSDNIGFWYSPYGFSRFQFPERHAYIFLGLKQGNQQLRIGNTSEFGTHFQHLTKDQLEDFCDKTFKLWKKKFTEIRKRPVDIDSLRLYGGCNPPHTKKDALEEVDRLRKQKFPGKVDLYLDATDIRKLGFKPETQTVSTGQEFFTFLDRYLS